MWNLKKHFSVKNIILWVIVLFFFIFVTLPFKHGGLFRTTDDIQVVRTDVMRLELLSFQFPVRYAQELGNGGGYFIFNFYPPLTYYVGFIFLQIGIPLVKTIKILFLLGFLFGALGFYFFTKKYTDKISASVSSILFLTSSYLAFDVYFRGALPEMLAFAMLPWLFLSFFKTKLKPSLSNLAISGSLYGLTMLFHTTIGVGIFPVLFLLFIFPPYSKKSFLYLFSSLILGLCLCSFYLLPSVIEQSFTMYKNSYFVTTAYVGNFINPLQAAGIMKISRSIETPLVGLGIYIGTCFSLFFFVTKKYTKLKNNLFLFLFGGFVLSTLLAWDIAKPLWANITYLRYFQFPYRFLAISTACGIGLTALVISVLRNIKLKILFGIIVILPAITFQYSYLRPVNFEYVSKYTADDGCSTTTWTQEYLPILTKECLPKKNRIPLVKTENSKEQLYKIKELNNGRNINFIAEGAGGKITVSRYFFPGWEIFVDNKLAKSFPSGKNGLITFYVPKGRHNISVLLSNTLVRKFGNYISLFGIIVVIILISVNNVKNLLRNKKFKKSLKN